MKSGEAFGWLIAGLLNDHVLSRWDPEDVREDPRLAEQDRAYAPCCCGPCDAWESYFSKAQAITDTYTRQLPDRSWMWMKADGGVNWDFVKDNMALAQCSNHIKPRPTNPREPVFSGHGESGNGLVTIRTKDYLELVEDQKMMIALQNAGVDNWEGYDQAVAQYTEGAQS